MVCGYDKRVDYDTSISFRSRESNCKQILLFLKRNICRCSTWKYVRNEKIFPFPLN